MAQGNIHMERFACFASAAGPRGFAAFGFLGN
jgi:hypothetical protein